MTTAFGNGARARRRVFMRLFAALLLVGAAVTATATAAAASGPPHLGPATPFKLVANTGYCMSSSGSIAVLNKCSGSDYQNWYPAYPYLDDGTTVMWQQKASGKCLDINAAGAYQIVYLHTCDDQSAAGDGSQIWFKWAYSSNSYANDKYYGNSSPNNDCFGVTSVTAGRAIQMVPCSWNNLKVQWSKSAS